MSCENGYCVCVCACKCVGVGVRMSAGLVECVRVYGCVYKRLWVSEKEFVIETERVCVLACEWVGWLV